MVNIHLELVQHEQLMLSNKLKTYTRMGLYLYVSWSNKYSYMTWWTKIKNQSLSNVAFRFDIPILPWVMWCWYKINIVVWFVRPQHPLHIYCYQSHFHIHWKRRNLSLFIAFTFLFIVLVSYPTLSCCQIKAHVDVHTTYLATFECVYNRNNLHPTL